MAAQKQTLYDILGLAPGASDSEVVAAYQRRTVELQERSGHDPGAAALAHEAYEVLRHPERRRAYDASLAAARERAEAKEPQPDVVIEDAQAPARRKLPWPLLAAIVALALAVLYFALRPARLPDPQSAKAPPAAPAPEPTPAPPPPPRERSASDILKDATAAAGRLSSVEMSGRATPLGMAVAIEPATMVTTCHGIPAGSKLVVQIGKESFPADLAITDERLDLCRLTVAGLAARPVGLAPDAPVAGTRIFALGVNAAGQFALTEGTVKQLRPTPEGQILELSMPIAAMGSGGAVFDAQGRLLAIATTMYRDAKGDSLALPATWIAQMRSRGAS
jgi:S1-C subfamily serine protease